MGSKATYIGIIQLSTFKNKRTVRVPSAIQMKKQMSHSQGFIFQKDRAFILKTECLTTPEKWMQNLQYFSKLSSIIRYSSVLLTTIKHLLPRIFQIHILSVSVQPLCGKDNVQLLNKNSQIIWLLPLNSEAEAAQPKRSSSIWVLFVFTIRTKRSLERQKMRPYSYKWRSSPILLSSESRWIVE